MFRFNNPDAAMVLLMTAAAYCTVRALDCGREEQDRHRNGARWMALAGVAVGFAFLAKMLEGVMVMPALAGAYLVAAPVPMRRRWLHLLGGATAFVASAGWFVVLTLLWPASAAPVPRRVDGQQLHEPGAGLQRLRPGDGPQPPRLRRPRTWGPWRAVSCMRIRGSASAGSAPSRRAGRGWCPASSGTRSAGCCPPPCSPPCWWWWRGGGRHAPIPCGPAPSCSAGGSWSTRLVLTLMHGMIHPYYSLSIAPPVAAMFALGVGQLWARRESAWYRGALAVHAVGHRGVRLVDPAPQRGLAACVAVGDPGVGGGVGAGAGERADDQVQTRGRFDGVDTGLDGGAGRARGVRGGDGRHRRIRAAARWSGPRGPAMSAGARGTGLSIPLNWIDMLKHTDTKWSAAIDRSSSAAASNCPPAQR